MHPVSYNHSAAVLLTPTRSFLVLSGTGMHWRWIRYFSRLLMPSRTTSSLTCHVITSVSSWITFTRRKCGLPSHCAEDEDETNDTAYYRPADYAFSILHICPKVTDYGTHQVHIISVSAINVYGLYLPLFERLRDSCCS